MFASSANECTFEMCNDPTLHNLLTPCTLPGSSCTFAGDASIPTGIMVDRVVQDSTKRRYTSCTFVKAQTWRSSKEVRLCLQSLS